jgi:hypothetical protein
MKKFLSIMTVLALTFTLATASAKEDPKKVSAKKEKACCMTDAKEAKDAKADHCATDAKASKMDCCKEGKAKASKGSCDMSKCGDKAKVEKTSIKTDAKN